MNIVAERLSKAMELRGVDQSALARAIGVTQGTISLILLGKTRQSKYLPAIAIELNVAYDWLIGRIDDMQADAPTNQLLTPDEVEMVEALRALPNLDRLAVRRVVEGVSSLQKSAAQQTQLPPENALARMFEGLLRSMDLSAPVDVQALLLAKRLPIGLSQLRDLLPDTALPVPRQTELPAALAMPDRGHQ